MFPPVEPRAQNVVSTIPSDDKFESTRASNCEGEPAAIYNSDSEIVFVRRSGPVRDSVKINFLSEHGTWPTPPQEAYL